MVVDKVKNWYLLKVQFNFERLVADNLNKAGKNSGVFVRCLVPMERTFVERKGVKELKDTVYMRGYVYVETYVDSIGEVSGLARNIRGTQGFMRDKNSIYPKPLNQRDIKQLTTLVGEEVINSEENVNVSGDDIIYTGKNTMVVSSPFKEKDAVRIKTGVYENWVAEVLSVDNNLIRVAIKIFGKEVPIEVDKNELEHM
jgi:transcription antitermination factor NusG